MPLPLLHLLSNPLTYGSLAAYFFGTYAIWLQAKKYYWNTAMVFGLVAIGLVGAIIAGLLTHQLFAWPDLLNPSHFWSNNHPNLNLAGAYLGASLASIWYIKRQRYPLWRALDMAVVGLMVAELILWGSWLIQNPTLINFIIGPILLVFTILLIYLSTRTWAAERLAGIHLAMIFLRALIINIMASSWQNLSGLLELVSNSCWLVAGCAIVLLKTSAKSRQLMLNDLPRGVSQVFRDTFMRAFANTATNNQKEPFDGHHQS